MELEELYIVAFSDVDCDSYVHSDLCYYLVELVHESLRSKRKLRDLQQLLLDMAMAIEEVLREE